MEDDVISAGDLEEGWRGILGVNGSEDGVGDM